MKSRTLCWLFLLAIALALPASAAASFIPGFHVTAWTRQEQTFAWEVRVPQTDAHVGVPSAQPLRAQCAPGVEILHQVGAVACLGFVPSLDLAGPRGRAGNLERPGALTASLRPLPYPPSRILAGLEWTGEPHRYPGVHSDMHWHTWGADDAIYSVDGDGSFPNAKDYYGSLSRITGTPTHHHLELITQFRELRIREDHTPEGMRRYFCGPLAVDRDLYVCLYDYDWRIPGRDVANRQDFLAVDRYSKLGGIPGILRSRDGGRSWTNVPGANAPRFLGPNFGNLQFIGFGPGYTRVPPAYGDFVYAISNDSNWESGDHLRLARVHRDRVLERAAWEFFNGTPESPAWTPDEAAAKPVFRDPGHVGHSDMTYVPALQRFLLCVFSDTVPHRQDASFEETRRWEKHTELQIYEGPAPWGPWGLVYREEPWGGPDHACYLPHLPAKWLAADGRSGWMLYSGDWEVSHYPRQPYYGYMTRPFRLRPVTEGPQR